MLAGEVAALLAMCGVAILWVAYARTDAARQKKAIEASVQELRVEANLVRSASERVRQGLETQARRYVSAQRETRLQKISLDELRKAGVTNVRWGALKGAGVRTVSDVIRIGQSGLEFIEGVGPTSAARVVSAATLILTGIVVWVNRLAYRRIEQLENV